MLVFGDTVLDSCLRGNDGKGVGNDGKRGGEGISIPLILNLLKDGPPPFRPIRSFPPPLPILQQVQDERIGTAAAPPPVIPA